MKKKKPIYKDGGKAGKGKQLPVKYVDDPKSPELQRYNDSSYSNQVSTELGKLVVPGHYDSNADSRGIHSEYGVDQWLMSRGLPSHFTGHTPDNYNGIKPEKVNWISKDGYELGYPSYKKPVQPVQYRHEQENIQSLPYTGQPTDIPQQQMQGIPNDYFNPQQDHWQSPNVVDGKLVQPAGMYKMQQGGGLWNNNKQAYVDSVLGANKQLEWVQRLYDTSPETINIPGEKYPTTHYMESGEADGKYYAYPAVQKLEKQKNIEYLGKGAFDYSLRHKTAIPFQSNEQAEWFANNGYKKGTGVLPQKKQYGGELTPASGMYKQQYGGQAMNTKKKGYKTTMKYMADAGINLPPNRTSIGGQSAINYNNQIPDDVLQGYGMANSDTNLANDPVAQYYMQPGHTMAGQEPLSPSVIDQYREPQAAPTNSQRRSFQGPTVNFNTGDAVAGLAQGINAIIPPTKVKQNKNYLQQAINSQPNGTGSHSAFKDGGWISKAVNPDHKGYCTPMTKETCTPKRKAFAKTMKKHHGFHKADDGANLNWDSWNNYHNYAAQNDPNYGTDTLNHGNYGNPVLTAYNQQYPGQAIQPQDISRYQQAAIGNTEITMPYGQSAADNISGQRTSAYSHKSYITEHYDPKGNLVTADSRNWGTDNIGAHQVTDQWQKTMNQPTANYPQAQPIGQGFNQSVQNTATVMAPGFSTREQAMAKGKSRTQQTNWHTKGSDNYSVDNTRMAYGGPVPIKGAQGLYVDNDQYKNLSDSTIELTGPKHTQGGIDLAANGTQVEAEGGETVAINPVDNSTQILGNLYMSGTNQKHKDVMKGIAKLERHIDKKKDKASYFLNNYSDSVKYQQPTFGTGRVLADAISQQQPQIQAMKQAVIDDNNLQLEMADHYGVKPVAITNDLKGKAKFGAKLPTYKAGGDPNEGKKLPVNDTAYAQVYNSITGQTEFVPDTEGYIPPNELPFEAPNLRNRKGMGAQRLGQITPRPMATPSTAKGTTRKQEKIAKLPAIKVNNPSWEFDGTIPYQDSRIDVPHASGYTPGLPTAPPNWSMDHGVRESQLRTDIPTLPAVKIAKDATATGKVKGIRNKFHIGNYPGEIATALDQVEPVPSMQVNPILENDYNLSFQNEKNAIVSAYKPALGSQANNPAAQAAISGQMAEQLANVDAKEQQFNDQNRGQIRGRNLQELRGVRDTNLQLTNDQMTKQLAGSEMHKENLFRAAQSVGTKEAQRQASNTQLKMYEQGYGWVMGPDGQYQMIKPGYEFSTPTASLINPDAEDKKKKSKVYTYDTNGKRTGYTQTEEGRYGKKMMMGGIAGMQGQMASMAAPSYFGGPGNYKKRKKK